MIFSLTVPVPAFTEATSLECWRQMQQVSLPVHCSDRPSPIAVDTNYVDQGQGETMLFLHGFDSSVLEFRRLLPLIKKDFRVIAVDLLGFGFTTRSKTLPPTPANIKIHLDHFWQTVIQEPITLVGVSMGGAVALDFCLSFPERVKKLVLIDSAGLAKQPFASRLMFAPVDRWLTKFLANPNVRQSIGQAAYYDRNLASEDARRCAEAHLACAGWSDGLIAFTKSGGYGSFSQQLGQIASPSLIIWGKQDKILGTKAPEQFRRLLPQSQLLWLDTCGHVPHLEQPEATAAALRQFCL
ncbi:alpha/beta hydrolase [Synechocystis sp. PCC 7339]|uniref:alpha/beta fold hydrolase n=1 Tax=unclassified Synechocystis TaxID=2640012 RepID=UPI001BAEA52A|nr:MULTISPECIES: alpha/beta hydrolase [unclassified Synechocystis]QUS61674.1 alpha/beta hydrolase [Synechocystis sp. PCC 7338]UAJ73873.1 alpha/beta hydrolase [Synechocystis sp. PCC 7339]